MSDITIELSFFIISFIIRQNLLIFFYTLIQAHFDKITFGSFNYNIQIISDHLDVY